MLLIIRLGFRDLNNTVGNWHNLIVVEDLHLLAVRLDVPLGRWLAFFLDLNKERVVLVVIIAGWATMITTANWWTGDRRWRRIGWRWPGGWVWEIGRIVVVDLCAGEDAGNSGRW